MESSPYLIKLEQVSKVYRTGDIVVPALRDVSIAIAQGEFVAIMGASGSGKSTLMNLIGCLDRPTSGQYLLAGHLVSALDRNALAVIRNRFIGFVFQSFNLLPRASAMENVELPMFYADVPTAERRRRARERLMQVGLEHRLEHRPNQLSGGQQQRVAIARAIVMNPRIILADEPTGNLDSKSSVEIMDLLERLSASGITVVLVTHELDIAAYASRRVVMKDGQVLSDTGRANPIASHNQKSSARLEQVSS